MSVWTTLMGGPSVKNMPSDPTMEGWQKELFNYDPGLGWFGKRDRQIGKMLANGEDVSDLGELSSISQSHAANRRDIADQYQYGGNALIANNAPGSEQANILQRMKSTDLAKDYERMGQEYTQGVTNLRGQAEAGFSNARNARIQAELAAKQAALGSRNNYYNSRYQVVQNKGLFPTLSEMGKNAASMMYGGGAGFATP